MSAATGSIPYRAYKSDHLSVGGLNYRPDIDGLRAVAVLAVILFHAAPEILPGGFTGVDIFFVISGYLISSIIFRGLSKGTFSFAEFYSRRAKRIFPALVVVMLVTYALCWLTLLPDEYKFYGLHAAAGSGFALNLELYRESLQYFDQESPLLHLWSLGIEEQFYLFWPVFVTLAWKSAKSPFFLLVTVSIISFCLNVVFVVSDPLVSFYLPTSRLWELAVGGTLAYVHFHRETFYDSTNSKGVKNFLLKVLTLNCHVQGLLGAGFLIASFAGLNSGYTFPGWYALIPIIGTLLLISAGTGNWISRMCLMNRTMVGIGLISYPLYLWHWPLLKLSRIVAGGKFTVGTAAVVVIASFALAWFTYQYVERPIRSFPRNFVAAFSLCTALFICGSIGYLISIGTISSRPLTTRVERFYRAADEGFPPDNEWGNRDRFATLGTGSRLVVFIGDSNVFQYYARIEQLVSSHPHNTHAAVLAGRGSCALGAAELSRTPDVLKVQCEAFLAKAIEFAKRPDVDAVVIGGAWYGYFVPWRDHDHYGESAPLRAETERSLEVLRAAIQTLVAAGKKVDIILQTPVGVKIDPRKMIQRTVLAPGFEIKIPRLTRAELSKAVDPIDERLRVVARESGARVIDPVASLCDEIMCPVVTDDGEPMYRDIAHLRPSYIRDHVQYLDEILLDSPSTTTRVDGAVPGSSPFLK
jgi:peptidoglycan/LPS O-acetylase OafA/YrhL